MVPLLTPFVKARYRRKESSRRRWPAASAPGKT